MTQQRNVILVTTDGSEHARRVLPHAGAFAKARGDSTLLVEIVESPGDSVSGDGFLNAPLNDGEGVPEAIVRVAAQQGAHLIAMDTRGHNAVHHAVHGSTALDVLSKTTLPVLLTGAELSDDAPSASSPYRIVVTSDGSEASQDVIKALAPLLTPDKFAVMLLRIHERESDAAAEASELAECEAQLKSLLPLFPSGLDVQTKVREIARMGGVDTAIIEEAQGFGASSIATSTHGTSAARHLLAGSTALLLLGRSPLPVIMARAAE